MNNFKYLLYTFDDKQWNWMWLTCNPYITLKIILSFSDKRGTGITYLISQI